MTATIAEARDDILDLFATAWATTSLPVRYWDAPDDDPIDTSGAWAAIRVQFVGGRQASFGGLGSRRYERTGIITVQVFTPVGTGASQNDTLVKTVMDAFEGKDTPRGVWFRQVRAVSVGIDGEWFQTNVDIDFTYDEVK